MQRLRTWILFIRALRRAGWYACVQNGLDECMDRFYGGLKAIWPWPRTKFDPDLARRRLEVCEKCDFFVDEYRTCGAPDQKHMVWVNPVTNKDEPVGCFCFMPYKVKMPNATCWASEKSNGTIGWEAEL